MRILNNFTNFKINNYINIVTIKLFGIYFMNINVASYL
jgi:hypothetical protein